jgi:hypothetical protein
MIPLSCVFFLMLLENVLEMVRHIFGIAEHMVFARMRRYFYVAFLCAPIPAARKLFAHLKTGSGHALARRLRSFGDAETRQPTNVGIVERFP